MGKLVQMNRHKVGSQKKASRRNVALKNQQSETDIVRNNKRRPQGDLVLFTGVRYERHSSKTLTPWHKIIANNNFKNG